MSLKNSKKQTQCPFTVRSLEESYGAEVSMFLHCHLRGYDRDGEGKYPDQEYYDKYGAPMNQGNSWEEGYHVVEKKIAEYCNNIVNNNLEFPMVAGVGGGVHLYKPLHNDTPWNWTGWVPRQKRWLTQGMFFSNRYFLALRGNEIQNNLWDYHPHEEEEDADPTDLEYSQLEPNDRYRGGYWFYRQPFGRYLHIIALKSHEKDPKTNVCQRYNYVAHPLAYRASIENIPDNTVDAMQWSIINLPEEEHFGEGKPWGEKCHGIEIFNDFTYYYSYQPLGDGCPNNGTLCRDPKNTINGDNLYYFWFDTYPLEFGVFLLESALARGVYLHTLSANDAFYKRHGGDEEAEETLSADPKGHLAKECKKHRENQVQRDPRLDLKQEVHEKTQEEIEDEKRMEKAGYLNSLPYKTRTCFGFVTLFDPRRRIREAVFNKEDGIPHMGLDDGETLALDYLNKGRYYATTGVWDLFDYDYHSLPFKIFNQPDEDNLCYEITEDMDMVFTFLPCSKRNKDLVWKYTIMVDTPEGELEKVNGYFKLSPRDNTKADLRSYDKTRVKWIYFTAIKPKNPQHRAWLHAIKGPAFGKPYLHARIAKLKHSVESTYTKEKGRGNTVTPKERIKLTQVNRGLLDFTFGKASNEHDIHAYFMQVYPLQQDLTTEPVSNKIKESSDLLPPKILQSVHGYFQLRKDHPTRIDLTGSWDKFGVVDPASDKAQHLYFYTIDAETGTPRPMDTKPKHYGKN